MLVWKLLVASAG